MTNVGLEEFVREMIRIYLLENPIVVGGLTAQRAVITNAGGSLATSTTTDTELGYVNGVTSAIQTQIDTKITASSTDTLTNKTFDADGTGNSITNIENGDIKAAAAIAVNKLAALTASTAVVTDGSGFISSSATTAAQIAALPRIFTKPSDTTINNDDVLSDDPDLQFSVAANSVYVLLPYFWATIKSASDFKYTFTVPAGATMNGLAGSQNNIWNSGGNFTAATDLTATLSPLIAADNTIVWSAPAFVETAGTAGTVVFQWAQNTAVMEDTTVKKGSTFIVYKVV